MSTEEKLKDLIRQATESRSHYYVRSIAEEALAKLTLLEAKLKEAKKIIEGVVIEPDPNGGEQLVISDDDGTYRLRLGEIILRETLDKWLSARCKLLEKIGGGK